MKALKFLAAALVPLASAGCVTTETVRFQAGAQQQALVRDGRSALVSRKKDSLVMVSPASREFRVGARPVYVLAINNLGKQPADFRVADVEVRQVTPQATYQLAVKTYEQLAQEERNRQVAAAILVGLAAGANAAVASQAGYGTAQSRVYSGGRVATVSTTYYSPAAAAIAQGNAAAQNEAMIANTIENGRANMAYLERDVVKDHSVMPGEWYGGQLHFEPPQDAGDQGKAYSIQVRVGEDVHTIDVVQAKAGS